ncbi:hypothetical protein DE146DRAFT_110880 [Phaeosphaeria sp. MPI-PUGE-AT-0046c]|nr:hypothetical protein DE146DRAFT_110880 [Phaeosphaeria sp. MPI-PUGE-AT-0046c]
MADHAMPLPAALVRLPDEILLDVAMRVGCAIDLGQLALTHRRFRFIVQDVLVRNGRLSINNIPRYIELLEQNQGWIAQIKHIEFKRVPPHYEAFGPTRKARKACARLVRALALTVPDAQRQMELEMDLKLSESWVLVLLAILPNATTLTIASDEGSLDSRCAPLLTRQYFGSNTSSGLRHELLDMVEGRLATVSITMDKAPTRLPKIPFRLVHFKALKTCTVAGNFVSGVHFQPPDSVLPQQLELLRITCDQNTCPWDWIDWLQQQMMRNLFQSLQSVQLFVDQPCRSFLDHMELSPPPSRTGTARFQQWFARYRRNRRDVLDNWEGSEATFETYFKYSTSRSGGFDTADYTEANLLQELRSMEEERSAPSSAI